MEFPYQVVTFLNSEPEEGQLIYEGPKGWLPQIAIKRRFAYRGEEGQLIEWLEGLAQQTTEFQAQLGERTRPERMPVDVIPVQSEELMALHKAIFDNSSIASKYPDREGSNFYPHVTVEYGGKSVVDAAKFAGRIMPVKTIWLVKDEPGEASTKAYRKFDLQ